MLTLLEALYNCGWDEDLSKFLLAEEAEDYRDACRYEAELTQRLVGRLSEEDRPLWEAIQRNREEAGDGMRRLSFRRGLAVGVKLASLASWAP